MRLVLVIVTCLELARAQESVKLGEIVHNLIFPSEQLMGTSGKLYSASSNSSLDAMRHHKQVLKRSLRAVIIKGRSNQNGVDLG